MKSGLILIKSHISIHLWKSYSDKQPGSVSESGSGKSNTSDFLHWLNDPNAAQDLGMEGKDLDAAWKCFIFFHDMLTLNSVWYLP